MRLRQSGSSTSPNRTGSRPRSGGWYRVGSPLGAARTGSIRRARSPAGRWLRSCGAWPTSFRYTDTVPFEPGDLVLIPESDAFPDAAYGRVIDVEADGSVTLAPTPLPELLPRVDLEASIMPDDGLVDTASWLQPDWLPEADCGFAPGAFTPPRVEFDIGPPSASGGVGSVEVDGNWLDTQVTTTPPHLRVELPLRTTVGLSTELALGGRCTWKLEGPRTRLGVAFIGPVPITFTSRLVGELTVDAAGRVSFQAQWVTHRQVGFDLVGTDMTVINDDLSDQDGWNPAVEVAADLKVTSKVAVQIDGFVGGVSGLRIDTGLELAAVLDATCPTPPLGDGWLTLTPAMTLTPSVAVEQIGHDYDDAPVDFDLPLTVARPFAGTNGAWCSPEPAPDPDPDDVEVPRPGPTPTNWQRVTPTAPALAGGYHTRMLSLVALGTGCVAVGQDLSHDLQFGHAAAWTSPDGLRWNRVPHDPAVVGTPDDMTGMTEVVAGGPGLTAVGGDDQWGAAAWVADGPVTRSRLPPAPFLRRDGRRRAR